jgi:hypothetical protein
MPTIYVDVDSYLDAVAYAAADTITVRYGAILTIRESNVNQPFQITTTDSVIKVATEQRKLVLNAAGYVNCVAGDIGKTVVGADTGDTGTLVDYNNATYTWHVLRDDPTDDQFDDVNEAISITGGTGAGTMNGAAAQFLILKFNATVNSGIVVSGNGKLMTRGDWYPLGTGNGAAAQTFAFYGAEACPYVRVETGNGTGIFTDCRCVYNTLLTTYGAGVYMGNVFQHAPDAGAPIANLTFGDGTNGMVVPNLARVQCPDIFITSAAAYTATYTSRSRFYYSGLTGGCYDLTNVILSDRFSIQTYNCRSFLCSFLGLFGRGQVQNCAETHVSHFICAKDRAVAHQYGFLFYYTSGTFEYINAETYGSTTTTTSTAFYIGNSFNFTVNHITCVITQKSGTSDYNYFQALVISYCSLFSVSDVQLVGGPLYSNSCGGPISVNNIRYTDTPSGAKVTTNPGVIIILLNSVQYDIDDVGLLAGGSPPYYYCYIINGVIGGLIKNVAFNLDTHTAYLFNISGATKDIILANWTMTGTTRTGLGVIAANVRDCFARNILLGVPPSSQIAASRFRMDGVVSCLMSTDVSGTTDTPHRLVYDSAAKLTGYIYLVMSPDVELSYYDRLAGDANKSIYFDNIGELYMKSVNDSCTFEIPYLIQGVSSFQNVAATILHATWSGNCTKEYAIKSGAYGSVWGAWTACTAANLSAEAVDSTVGFYMKFRFTMTGAHATDNYCSRFMIPVNTDPAFMFPVGYVDCVLRGAVAGSEYWVYDVTNARTIGRGVAPGGDITIEVPCEFDFVDINIEVRVRKGSAATFYEPWETTATYDENGVIIFVAQAADAVVTADLTAPISFDLVNKLIIVADTVTEVTVQQLVNAIRDYETTGIETVALFAEVSGKQVLDATTSVAITLKLLDDWRVQFEDRAGPTYVRCRVTGGNLLADNTFGDDPIAQSDFTTCSYAMSTSATLITSPAQDAQAVRDAMKLAPSAGAPDAGSIDAHLDDMPADVDAQLGSTHGTHLWEKWRTYP